MTLVKPEYRELLESQQHQANRELGLDSAALECFPDEAQCSVCGYLDLTHPDVRRIIRAKDSTERLLQIAQCKCPARAREQEALTQRRWDQANLPQDVPGGRSFENFRQVRGTDRMVEALQEFALGKEPDLVVLVGSNGCGKSHLGEAVCGKMLDRGHRVRYEVAKRFLDQLRHTFRDGELDLGELISWYRGFPVLVLDDVGMEKATDFAAAEITDLADERIQYGRRTILATNKTRDEMAEHLGDRLASRMYATNELLGSVKLVVTDAADYRLRRGAG